MLTQSELKSQFLYDEKTGRLVRKICKNGQKSVTEGVSKQGYYIRWVNKQCYTEHSLVWLFHTGEFANELDHINRNKTDNRIENLRSCNRTLNNGNHKLIRTSNKSGYRGVSWSVCGKWWAQICCNKVHYNLGYYDNPEDAAKAYDLKAIELFGEFATINGVVNAYS